MSTDYDINKLMDLARLAPVVEVKQETTGPDFASIDEYIELLGINEGRNPVGSAELYEAYCLWASDPCNPADFKKHLLIKLKIDKTSGKRTIFKLNFKGKTILNKTKELLNKDEETEENPQEQNPIPRTD